MPAFFLSYFSHKLPILTQMLHLFAFCCGTHKKQSLWQPCRKSIHRNNVETRCDIFITPCLSSLLIFFCLSDDRITHVFSAATANEHNSFDKLHFQNLECNKIYHEAIKVIINWWMYLAESTSQFTIDLKHMTVVEPMGENGFVAIILYHFWVLFIDGNCVRVLIKLIHSS